MLALADRNLNEVKRQFADWKLAASWLAPTATALRKSTIDAVGPFRTFLKAVGVHDYGLQPQGPARKVTLAAHFVLQNRLVRSSATLYRPASGNGDPRIWFSGLDRHADAGNVIAVVPTSDGLAVINVSRQEIVESAYVDGSPLSTLIDSEQTAQIQSSPVGPTEKEQLIQARVGQGRFRKGVERIERSCRVTGITALEHLRASHIKPWKSSGNAEKLDPNNGLLLAPHIDHLFDRGFISFEDDGRLLVSSSLDLAVLDQFGIPVATNVGAFSAEQAVYLAYHRKYVLKR